PHLVDDADVRADAFGGRHSGAVVRADARLLGGCVGILRLLSVCQWDVDHRRLSSPVGSPNLRCSLEPAALLSGIPEDGSAEQWARMEQRPSVAPFECR